MKTGIILLAAGGSTRLGRPKQLIPCDAAGTPLIVRAAHVAIESGLGPVLVVLGAEASACSAFLEKLPVRCVFNPDWPEGQGGSIAAGMNALVDESLDAVLVMLCDQPNVTADTLRRLHAYHCASGASMTAARYAGTLGVPAIFSSVHFAQLGVLTGPSGAKALLRGPHPAADMELSEASLDLDTEADLAAWREEKLITL